MATIKEEAEKYRKLILSDIDGSVSWSLVNKDIIDRYGRPKLMAIKKLAWKQ